MKQSVLNFGKKDKKGLAKRPFDEDTKEDAKTAQVSKRAKNSPTTANADVVALPIVPKKEERKTDIKGGVERQNGSIAVETTPAPVPPPAISKLPKAVKKIQHKLVDKHFHPINDAPFDYNENVPFSFLVESLQEIEKCKGENSKDAIKEIISNVFRAISLLHPVELPSAFYFYLVKLAPEYKSKETGIGQEILVKAISRVVGRETQEIRDDKAEKGDLGTVLCDSKKSMRTVDTFFQAQKKKKVLLEDVMTALNRIADVHGANSQTEKLNILSKLLFDAEKEEGKYIVRWIEGTLKIGAAEQTVISALARAVCVTPFNQSSIINMREATFGGRLEDKIEKAEADIKRAISEFPDYEALVHALTKVGDKTDRLVDHCYIRPGTPVKPMLAKPTKGVQIILKRFENIEFTCEFKYDGFRGQIHLMREGTVPVIKVFSRNLEDMTQTYPDVVDYFTSKVRPEVQDFIMDSEIVAYDVKAGKILPFQELTTRARKKVNKSEIEVNVCIYAFDLLYLNKKSLLQTEFGIRRDLLHSTFTEEKPNFQFARCMNGKTSEELQVFFDESVRSFCEGLMVKTLKENSSYEPSKRSFKWLKLKKDYLDTEIGDSLDLVVVGADYGNGKRTGVYGSFLLAVFDPDTCTYQTATKIGTGFSDEELKKAHEALQPYLITKIHESVRHRDKEPDVWFEPRIVWEMRGADLTLSPVYSAGLDSIETGKGIGLRFPRFLRCRTDKKPKEASSSVQMIEMYKNQAVVSAEFKDDDY